MLGFIGALITGILMIFASVIQLVVQILLVVVQLLFSPIGLFLATFACVAIFLLSNGIIQLS
jgi:hypothetical protein